MRKIFFEIIIVLIVLSHFAVSSAINAKVDDNGVIDDGERLSKEELQEIRNFLLSANQTEMRSSSTVGKKPNKVKKPQIPPVNSDPVQAVSSRVPCSCIGGICSCCIGGFFFNNKGCMKLRYIPEDFAFEVRMMFNERTLYKTQISGKNPRPICISPPRFDNYVEICAKFHDIYFVGRNMHICLDLSASLGDFDLFDREFDCMKFGTEGVALVAPGDGHPGYPSVISAGTDAEIDAGGPEEIENYDEVVG